MCVHSPRIAKGANVRAVKCHVRNYTRLYRNPLPYLTTERLHVTSQSRENHMGGHFGVQLNGDLVCCMMCMQNAVQT